MGFGVPSLGWMAFYGVGGNCEKGEQARNFRPRFEVEMNSVRKNSVTPLRP
jgi:hypothetical protein